MADSDLHRPRPYCDWHEDRGDVLWWLIPITQAPWVGTPNDLGRKEQHMVSDNLSIVLDGVNAWPFDDCHLRYLWWTPLPDAKRVEDQVPL